MKSGTGLYNPTGKCHRLLGLTSYKKLGRPVSRFSGPVDPSQLPAPIQHRGRTSRSPTENNICQESLLSAATQLAFVCGHRLPIPSAAPRNQSDPRVARAIPCLLGKPWTLAFIHDPIPPRQGLGQWPWGGWATTLPSVPHARRRIVGDPVDRAESSIEGGQLAPQVVGHDNRHQQAF